MNDVFSLLLGAALAVIGGGLGDEYRAWREEGREKKYIQSAIADELGQIVDTINKMDEVWTQTTILSSSYITELRSNTAIFDDLRKRLILVDETKRKKIINFYKKFKDALEKAEGKVGSLADTDAARNEQAAFHNQFSQLGTDAANIKMILVGPIS